MFTLSATAVSHMCRISAVICFQMKLKTLWVGPLISRALYQVTECQRFVTGFARVVEKTKAGILKSVL
jgi:hypothetical protein